jgi:hypothetical protein
MFFYHDWDICPAFFFPWALISNNAFFSDTDNDNELDTVNNTHENDASNRSSAFHLLLSTYISELMGPGFGRIRTTDLPVKNRIVPQCGFKPPIFISRKYRTSDHSAIEHSTSFLSLKGFIAIRHTHTLCFTLYTWKLLDVQDTNLIDIDLDISATLKSYLKSTLKNVTKLNIKNWLQQSRNLT